MVGLAGFEPATTRTPSVSNGVSHIESRWDIVGFLEYISLWMKVRYSFVSATNPAENVRYVSDGKRLVDESSASFIIVIYQHHCYLPAANRDLPRSGMVDSGAQVEHKFNGRETVRTTSGWPSGRVSESADTCLRSERRPGQDPDACKPYPSTEVVGYFGR
jgi:hypothetical protein